ncbi:MAG TPA: hypothetical protein VHL58_12985 [Thermoanaerobaculia bacterium]|nr:hypothetical protein [Thermoanaerobaculia bacterium]
MKPFRALMLSMVVLTLSATTAPLFAQLPSLSLTPATLRPAPNTTQTMTVSIPFTQTFNVLVNLTSSNTSVATVPSSVIIATGTLSKTFTLTAGSAPGSSTITASATNYNSATSTVTIEGLTLTPNLIRAPGAPPANMTVFTSVPTGRVVGLTVNLLSSDTSIATVPSSVVIPAGGFTSVSVPVTTGSIAGIATITASATNAVPDSATATVAGITLSPSPVTLSPGGQTTMTASINFGTVGFTINLVSSDTTIATVPATVVIPRGQTSMSFTVTGGTTAGSASITASNPNAVGDTASVTVAGLSLTPTTMTLGANSKGTLTVTTNFPGGRLPLTVNLASSDPSAATVPATVSIPAGNTSATFFVQAVGAGTTTITASNPAVVSATANITVSALPIARVIGSSFPGAILQLPSSGGSTSYVLTNLGPDPTDITLTKSDTFFTQLPTSFHLDKGASQVVTIQTQALATGFYKGFSIPAGIGVRPGFQIPVRVLVGSAPAFGKPRPQPSSNRGDVAGTGTQTATIDFTNTGDGVVTGILTSDVPWMSPQDGLITLQPGETKTITFTIDRTLREDSQGSDQCSLTLTYFANPSASRGSSTGINSGPPTGFSIVSVVDTTKPPTQSTSLPALPPGQIVLFIPGVGHILGSGGKLFLSDLSVTNKDSQNPLSDLNFFYKPADKTLSASKTSGSVTPAGSLSLGDVVKTVYGQDNQIGTMQIRTSAATTLSVGANVFNANNAKGTYGTTLPVFRSDRAAASGEKLVLTGLRKDATSHTNLYVQEGSGVDAAVQIDFLDANGAVVSSLSNQPVSTFGLLQINNAVPDNAVTAVITNTSGGKVFAFATPVDDASGDTWAVADWTKQFAKAAADSFVIPVVGTSKGANNTFFRTDVAITNGGGAQASATLRYFPRGGAMIQKQVPIAPRAAQVLNDVVGGLFGVVGDSVGFVIVVPSSGSSLFVTSRTYTSVVGQNGTFGTAVPALPAASALRFGANRIIGGLQDSNVSRTITGAPGTFRTNFGIIETTGASATVRVSVSFADGLQLSGGGTQASHDYQLAPNDFILVSGMVKSLLGDSRDSLFGDLHDVQIKFEVVSGAGGVIPFVSSTDNGTGDTVLRTE